jgi:hypothetical protein
MNTSKNANELNRIYYSAYARKQKALENREREGKKVKRSSTPLAEKKQERERERKKDKIPGPWVFRDGILCSWMCCCHGNCNLVTSLFLPNPALKLWLLHPFAWLT